MSKNQNKENKPSKSNDISKRSDRRRPPHENYQDRIRDKVDPKANKDKGGPRTRGRK